MHIKYDEIEMFELFEREPISIYEEEAGKFMYIKEDEIGMKLILNLDIYEQTCSFSLGYKDYSKDIYNSEYKFVKKFECNEKYLRVINLSDECMVEIGFKPNFYILT
jgi:hypothetical protein